MAAIEEGGLGELIGEAEKQVEAGKSISIGLVQQLAGGRAAGPLLLFPALIVMSPITIIPGIATLVGLNTVLVAGQIVLGREQVWLPGWLRRRCIPRRFAPKLMKFLKPVAKVADDVAKPRATWLTAWPLRRAGAAVCVLVGGAMPVFEVIPFTSTPAGAVIATYALAITVRDGFLALAWAGLVVALLAIAAAFFLG